MLMIFIQIYYLGGVDVYGNPVLNFCWHTNQNNKNKTLNFSKFSKIAFFDLFLKENGI